MRHVNLMADYPQTIRPMGRAASAENREIARQFGREYFDGTREQGYGGYVYDGRWVPIACRFLDYYQLPPGARVLDVGCAKGFLLHDLLTHGYIEPFGVDISRYALAEALPCAKYAEGSADLLPFPDATFDLVISINTVHNLPVDGCRRAISEIQRVSRKHAYLQVDSWLTPEQEANFRAWTLTAVTAYDPEGWLALFREASYDGDYDWTLTT